MLKNEICIRRGFYMFHFIDNLFAINNHLEFDRNFKNIYPSELHLKKDNISACKASFLDLSIIIENQKFKNQIYDKTDAFPFDNTFRQ